MIGLNRESVPASPRIGTIREKDVGQVETAASPRGAFGKACLLQKRERSKIVVQQRVATSLYFKDA